MPRQTAAGINSPMAPQGWILPAVLIVAVTLLAYLPAAWGGFFWDDDAFILQNRLIQSPDGLRRLWVTTDAAEYLPLTYTIHWIEWRLWSDHPAGYHIVNVLLHAAGAVLLWRVLRRLNVPGAWLAGVLFGVHPVAVASAGWIMELKNVLSMVLYLASLLAFLRFDELESAKTGESEGGTFPTYLLSVIFFLLALLSKTSVVMLPVVLLLCAWWRRGRISRKDLLRSVPFLALSLALGLVTVWFQWHKALHGGIARPEGVASRIAAAGWIVWFYLYKVLLPVGLCAIYPRWNVEGSSVLAFLPLLLLLGGMVFLWTRRKSWGRAPFFAAAYFLIALLPVLGFLDMSFMTYSLVADHFQYVAMIAVIAFAAGILARAGRPGMPRRGTVMLVAAGCAAVLAILTCRRASLYEDEKLVWRDNVATMPTVWWAWSNLGKACTDTGLHDEAIRCLDEAIALSPDRAELYYNRGGAWSKVRDFGRAIQDYDRAIALGAFATAYYNRGLAYAQCNDLARAIQDYGQAISLDKGYGPAYNNRGNAYARLGRNDEAVRDYTSAIELMPDNPGPHAPRAIAYYKMGEYGKAWADVKMCEKLGGRPNPEFLNALERAAPRPE